MTDQVIKYYFLPLMKEYYYKIRAGEQSCEIRPNEHRGWHMGNVYPGRWLMISNGYQKPGRLYREIISTMSTHDLKQQNIPQWHIDAVEEIYGKRDRWLIAYF